MRKNCSKLAVVVLCCLAGSVAGEEKPDARLVEAQAAFDEANALRTSGKYADAIPKAEHALELREAALGSPHPEVARSLSLVGDLHRLHGDVARAEAILQRALAAQETALGKTHPDVAVTLNRLAILYQNQAEYDRAEPLYERALSVRESALGKTHPLVADVLDNFAGLRTYQGYFSRAEPLFKRALSIREASSGPMSIEVAHSLHNLAHLYAQQGLYTRAEPLYQQALVIREATLPKSHPDIAITLNNLGNLYRNQGLYDRAQSLYERTLAIQKAAFGERHPFVAGTINNLALLHASRRQFDLAQPLFERILAIQESLLDKDHVYVALALHNLASTLTEQGSYDRAEPLFLRALTIREAKLAQTHPFLTSTLNGLADLYSHQGKHDRAEPLYARALTLRETALGKDHALLAPSLNGLARLRLRQGRLAEALPLLARTLAINEQRLRQEALGFSGARLAGLLQLMREDEERLYALARAHPGNAGVRRLALSAALLLKGRSVEELADTSRTIHRSLGTEDREKLQQLQGLRAQLAKLSLDGPGKLIPAEHQRRIQELSDRGDALEEELAQRSAPLRALRALPFPDEIVGRVSEALPAGAALVEYVAYADRPLLGTPKAPGQLRYLALVLLPGEETRVLDLGPAAPIDRAATRLRDALANRDAAFQTHAQALYRLAFRPLLPALGATRRVFLAPDGHLALVPFAGLHDGQQFLIDSFDLSYLNSGKELLPRNQEATATSVVVLADPDFGAPSQVLATVERSAQLERFFSSPRASAAQRSWTALPGTRQEAEAIRQLVPQAQLFLGAEATKDRLLNLPTPGVLHLATHGFFLEDEPTATGSRAVDVTGAPGGDRLAPHLPDPLLRSGLVLAGGPTPTLDSSLVTALELAGLDLWGTQLVVLSACDTGRGEVKLGQGVYGLRRAFVVAGAETVVMSLWKVNDDTTRQLMEAYYRNLSGGQGRAGALREAMRSFRASHPHPYDWAPFIVIGRDAPLPGLAQPPHHGG